MRGEKKDNIGNLLWSSDSRERDRWQYCPLEPRCNPSRLNWTQRNRVYSHSERAEFCRCTSRITLQSKLACAVSHFRRKTFSSSCAHIDDSAELRTSLYVPAGEFGNHQCRRASVHGKHPIKRSYVKALWTIRPQLHELIWQVSTRSEECICLPVCRVVHEHFDRPMSCLA